tara:strand:+ start:42 stop:1370 length:1329 start_codon:yes stop_codon:yes gene_type:complete
LGRKSNNQEYWLNKIKTDLDAIGPGFCILKWHYLELSLAEGLKHSCYHCPQHKIPLKSDLHNTPTTKEVRQQMLDGLKPAEDNYCYDIEKTGNYSDRQYLAVQFIKEDPNIIAKTAAYEPDEQIYPKYLTVSFTNRCQMSCIYCGAGKSSTWKKEIDEHGPYPLNVKDNYDKYMPRNDIMKVEDNPYVDKFWKWLPDAYPHLQTIRLTGGEPLLDENTFKLLQYVKDNPKKLSFEISTNLMVTDRRVSNYINLVKGLPGQKCYVSVDTWGEQAEWIRTGLKIEQFEHNLHRVLGNGIKVGIMCTFNLLSIPNFEEWVFKMAELKQQYPGLLTVDVPQMVEPLHLTTRIADKKLINMLDKAYKSMLTYSHLFEDYEISKFKRTIAWTKANLMKGEELERNRKDFVKFANEKDRRRGTNFLETFPELKEFYNDTSTTIQATSSI